MKNPTIPSLLFAAALGLALLGDTSIVSAQAPQAAVKPAAPAASPAPAATGPGVVILPEPTPTPGKPFVPESDAARGQAAVSQVRRLVRDVQSNTDSIKAVGNFGAQLYVIGDEVFYQDWRKPEAPNITPVQLAVRGQPVFTAVIFYGPARDDKGLANVSYDITVKRPDGSVFSERKAMVGWQNLAPDESKLILGRNYQSITVEPTDPVGIYTVEMTVHDNIGRVDLPLRQTFAVQ